jgi:hypothetical protein
MIEFRCSVCAALAYSSADAPGFSTCPACGAAGLEALGAAGKAKTRPAEPQELDLSAPMNASVQAVRAPQGLRG